MTKYPLLLLLFFAFNDLTGQIFGNTNGAANINFNPNYIVAYKIQTGPSDSGNFTHIGVNDQVGGGSCDIKLGIYDHNSSSNKPGTLLTDIYIASPPDGMINQFPLSTQPAILPNTFYWIAIRTNCNYGGIQESGQTWAMLPVHYVARAFGLSWPATYPGTTSYAGQNVYLFAIGNNQILPVELLSFNVDLNNKTPNLSWQVASELNNDGWHIQRSTNGFTWQSIDWVTGRGTSNQKHTYYYEDMEAPNGLIFYRLQQRDFDGTIAHSEVVSVYIEPIKITLYPNPAQNKIHLQGPNIGSSYEIRDVFGNQVKESFFGDKFEIDISSLNAGAYYLLLTDTNHNIPFIKK